MARVSFTDENRTQSGSDFPKFKLERGERARVVCLEDPVMEYIHDLKAPKIVNGQPETFVGERKNGEKYTDYKMDFVGRYLCLGDPVTLVERGIDPRNCPMCRVAHEGDTVKPPQRRFAMHIIRYGIKQGGFELATPFNVTVEVWAFTENRFNSLIDIAKDAPSKSLKMHDLMLGPCEDATFQKFDMKPSMKAEWLADEERKARTVETFRENQTPDLSAMCARKGTVSYIEDDLKKVADRWRVVQGQGSTPSYETEIVGLGAGSASVESLLSSAANETNSYVPSTETTAEETSSLLDSLPAGSQKSEPAASDAVSVEDLLAGL